jgi:hypothetical protein
VSKVGAAAATEVGTLSTEYTIEIETDDTRRALDLALDLCGSMRAGEKLQIADGATLTYEGTIERRAFGMPAEVTFALTLAANVPAGVVANWLYAKLRGKAKRLRIDRTEIEVNEGEIRRILREKIEVED